MKRRFSFLSIWVLGLAIFYLFIFMFPDSMYLSFYLFVYLWLLITLVLVYISTLFLFTGNQQARVIRNKQLVSPQEGNANSIQGFKRLDQLLNFLQAVLSSEARFPLKDIAEFLGIEKELIIVQINRMSQIRLEGENIIIPLILWEDIPQGGDLLLDKDHFIALLDAKFSRWGEGAKKKRD